MFDIGFWEVTLIGIVALVIVGPERLPGLARTVGLWVGKGRRMIADVKRDIDREIRESDMGDLSSVKSELDKVKTEVDSKARDFVKDSGMEDTQSTLKQAIEDAAPLKDEIKNDIDELDQVAQEVDRELGQSSTTPEPAANAEDKPAPVTGAAGKKASKSVSKSETTSKKTDTGESSPSAKPGETQVEATPQESGSESH